MIKDMGFVKLLSSPREVGKAFAGMGVGAVMNHGTKPLTIGQAVGLICFGLILFLIGKKSPPSVVS